MSVDKSLKIQLKDYDVKEIANKIYKINEYNLSTMFVIVGSERALCIDCGTGVGDYKAVIEKLTEGKPYDLVLSHGHVDHAGGREQFNDIYVSYKDKDIVKEATLGYRKFYILIMRYLMGFKCIKFKDATIKKVEKEPNLIPIKEGHIFDLGNKKIEVFECAGHTTGSICFLDREDEILFTGDILNPLMLMFLAHATSIEEYFETTEKLLKIDGYKTIWPSHLKDPLTFDDARGISNTARIILKQKHNFFLPSIFIKSKNTYSIIYRPDYVHRKKKERAIKA